jgi:hypothetical protein
MASVIDGYLSKSTKFRRSFARRIFAELIVSWIAIGCGQLAVPYVMASEPARSTQTIDRSEQRYYANAHAYLDDAEDRIILQIPELKGLREATDQNSLPSILDKTGATVDEFFHNVVNLVAREKISEQQFLYNGVGRQEIEDSYLILSHGSDERADMEECRVDAHGRRVDQAGIEKGFFVTSNFALSAIHFAAEYQANSRFRYLGTQKLGGRDALVVAFAQVPGQASISTAMQGRWNGAPYLVHMLVQGVAWIDASDFRIVRMRTDLLAPRRDIGLVRLTTEIDYAAETLPDVATPLWLIHQVKIYAHFSHVVRADSRTYVFDTLFRNDHLLTDYHRYGVTAVMNGEAVTAGQSGSGSDGNVGDGRSYVRVPEQVWNGSAPTYVEASLAEIIKEVPELKSLRPSADQKLLPAILEKTGARVDEFSHDVVDLTARETMKQARLDNRGRVVASHDTLGNYLIVHRKESTGLAIEEYRTDTNGNRTDSRGLSGSGYFVTAGFALNCNYFSSSFQPESAFRYLGMQKIDGRQTHVVAFAQKPSKATLAVIFRERDGTGVPMLVQGIAWIDEATFQVLRLRSDLLTPLYTIGLDRLTTEVDFSAVRLQDVATPLWLPREVSVRIFMNQYSYENADYYEQIYENWHRYADYQRFRVGVKVGP